MGLSLGASCLVSDYWRVASSDEINPAPFLQNATPSRCDEYQAWLALSSSSNDFQMTFAFEFAWADFGWHKNHMGHHHHHPTNNF